MKRSVIMIGMSALLAACVGNGDGETPGMLDVEQNELGLVGSYTQGDAALQFDTREVSPGVFDIVVEVNGMTLTAVVDRPNQVSVVDGFADAGADTQMVDADRALLQAFATAISEQFDIDSFEAADALYRTSSNWAQTGDTVPLQREVVGSEDRGWSSLCSSYGSYVKATHDDNNYGNWHNNSSSWAKVGTRTSNTYYLVNGSWTSVEQNHKPLLYEYGECYGNCGGGCPGGNQTLTRDCHNHDQCVRNGHALASWWCNDEFASASDDEFFAPRCSGT